MARSTAVKSLGVLLCEISSL